MTKRITLKFISAILLLGFPLSIFAQTVDPAFNANKLVDDKVFSDTQTFGGAEGVQKFLVAKSSVLANTGPDFLVKLKEPNSTALKQSLDDPEPSLPRLRTAAELIWDASKQSGLNPQIIIVTLNKEQGLIANQFTSNGALQTALDHAMGFDCPDGTGCGDLFPGFYYQLFGNFDSANNRYLGAAKSLMKSFSSANGRGPLVNGSPSHVGDIVTLGNTLGGYDNIQASQSVQLINNATAALYRYTPHVFNGNYNFWKFFQAWFKYPNGTLLKLASAADTYIIQNGVKQLVPPFVALARSLELANTIVVSPTEYDSYQTDKVLGPLDNTIVTLAGTAQKYVFIADVKHPVSDFVIKQRGLDVSKALAISPAESSLFVDGPVLTPNDGTIVRGQTNPAIYLVQSGSLQMYSAFTFGQRKISAKQVIIVPDAEVATYPKAGFVPPLDNTLFKSSADNTVYIAQSGFKHPVTAPIFKNLGLKFSSVVTLSGDEVAALPLGSYAAPKERSFFTNSDSGQIYMFKEGSKHLISPFVAKQRGITADFKVGQDMANQWLDGIPVAPRDGTVIMGDGGDATVYLVVNAQLRPMTYQAYKNRGITSKRISVLPQVEVDGYAKGDMLAK